MANKLVEEKMKTAKLSVFEIVFVILFFAGCGNHVQFKAVEQICLAKVDKSMVMAQAEDVLGGMHFKIDKYDIEHGIIRTKPLPAAQFFEFWRKDNAGAFNSAEANMHAIRRIAELKISQQNGQLCINCDVQTQRLSVADSANDGNISSSLRSRQKFEEDEREKVWIDLGRDARLETKILKHIEKKL